MPPSATLRRRVGVGLLALALVMTLVMGAFLLRAPPALALFGCERTDEHVAYGPAVAIDVEYDHGQDTLTLTHGGGDALTANGTATLTATVRSGASVVRYNWTEAGGEYPIREGDTITIGKPQVDGEPLQAGDRVVVRWTGPVDDGQPGYCPYDTESETRTVGERVIESA